MGLRSAIDSLLSSNRPRLNKKPLWGISYLTGKPDQNSALQRIDFDKIKRILRIKNKSQNGVNVYTILKSIKLLCV